MNDLIAEYSDEKYSIALYYDYDFYYGVEPMDGCYDYSDNGSVSDMFYSIFYDLTNISNWKKKEEYCEFIYGLICVYFNVNDSPIEFNDYGIRYRNYDGSIESTYFVPKGKFTEAIADNFKTIDLDLIDEMYSGYDFQIDNDSYFGGLYDYITSFVPMYFVRSNSYEVYYTTDYQNPSPRDGYRILAGSVEKIIKEYGKLTFEILEKAKKDLEGVTKYYVEELNATYVRVVIRNDKGETEECFVTSYYYDEDRLKEDLKYNLSEEFHYLIDNLEL